VKPFILLIWAIVGVVVIVLIFSICDAFKRRCTHDWVIVDKTILPSAWEQIADKAQSFKSGSAGLFEKKYICILQCNKCGALNKTVEVNP
jgi:hypothetical protein